MTKEDFVWRYQQEVLDALHKPEAREELLKNIFKDVEEGEPNYATYTKMIVNGIDIAAVTAVQAVFETLFSCGAIREESLKDTEFDKPFIRLVKNKEK